MQIKINLKVFLFLLIFLITRQIKIYALLMCLALIHELGHVMAGIILGFKPESISIIPTGFSVKFKNDFKNYNKKIKNGNMLALKKAIIAFAGPLVNLIIMAISIIYYKITEISEIAGISIELLIYSNLLIFIFNMLPIYPLDGGQILKEIVHIKYGLFTAYVITNKISNVVVIILTAFASFAILEYKNIAILIIIAYLWGLVANENKKYNLKLKIWKNFKFIDNC